jgi:tetratricopeptide (TPR) repeat protein
MVNWKSVLKIFTLVTIVFLSGCKFWFASSPYDNLRKADEAVRRKDYQTAIDLYQQHIDYRLTVKDRPEWENPYFYLLQIGDIQLGQEKDQDAIKSYLRAEENGVDKGLISDRIRYIGAWYEERGRLDDAFQLLKAHKARDPLLFDLALDRIAKEMVKKEENDRSAKVKSK